MKNAVLIKKKTDVSEVYMENDKINQLIEKISSDKAEKLLKRGFKTKKISSKYYIYI